MGGPEVEEFLSCLATTEHVAASTHTQALSALLFFYDTVLGVDLPWMVEIGRRRTSAYNIRSAQELLGHRNRGDHDDLHARPQDRRHPLAGTQRAGKAPVLAADGSGPDLILDQGGTIIFAAVQLII